MKRFALAMFVLLARSVAVCQSTAGSLEGHLINHANEPVIGATIAVQSDALQGSRGCSTDERGFFRLLVLPPGEYSIRVRHLSYKEVGVANVRVMLGRTTNIGRLVLSEGAIDLPGVTISGARPLIDPTSTTAGLNLSMERIQELPVDRSYQSIPQLLPHVNKSFFGDQVNFSGATGLENRYFVNGAEVTDLLSGFNNGNLPYNFVQEVQVKTGAYEAEFRGSLGGIVDVITPSGSNELKGQVFGFFTNNQLAGSPRYRLGEPPKGDFSQYDIGVSFGGPLLRDKLWYFMAYNAKVDREIVQVPDQPNQEDQSLTHMFAGKLNWQASEGNNFTISIVGDPRWRRGVGGVSPMEHVANLEAWLSDIRLGGINALMNSTHLLTSSALLETSFSVGTQLIRYQPINDAGKAIPYVDWTTRTISGGYQTPTNNTVNRIEGSVKGTLLFDNHKIKGGLEYQQASLDSDERLWGMEKYDASFYDSFLTWWRGLVTSKTLSAFMQDSWQPWDRVTVNAGIRLDAQFMYNGEGEMVQKITNMFQPRVGIIVQPWEQGNEKLFASYGRFYQTLLLALSQKFHSPANKNNLRTYPNDPRVDTTGSVYTDLSANVTNVSDLRGQHYDEFTLGYEQQLFSDLKVSVRGIYRTFREGVEDGFVDQAMTDLKYGNPGRYPLEMYPRMQRDYEAFEISFERASTDGLNLLASYVLSRNYGNYTGLGLADYGFLGVHPNSSFQFQMPYTMDNNTGLLPNDRTHVFKIAASYRFLFGLHTGVSFQWMSGTPMSEFGSGPWYMIHLRQRGTAGRTPSIWDLNLRIAYDMAWLFPLTRQARLIAEWQHVASQRKAVWNEDVHYWVQDANGNQASENPFYGQPIAFQPPMSVRLGMEVNF